MPRAIEDILSIVRNTYEHDGENNVNGSSLIEDFGTDTTPILSLNPPGAGGKFGLPANISPNSQI